MTQLTFHLVYFFSLTKEVVSLKQNCIKFSPNKLIRVNKSKSNLVLFDENRSNCVKDKIIFFNYILIPKAMTFFLESRSVKNFT